jgi:hypothetical protein
MKGIDFGRILAVIVVTTFLLSNIALAQPVSRLPITPVGPTTIGGIVDLLRQIVRWIYIIFFIVAVAFILFAAFTYLMAGSDEGKVEKARNMILYAAIAIVVALMSVGFEQIIRNFLQSPTQ